MVCASVRENIHSLNSWIISPYRRTNYTVTYAHITLSSFHVQAINLGLFKTHFWRTKNGGRHLIAVHFNITQKIEPQLCVDHTSILVRDRLLAAF